MTIVPLTPPATEPVGLDDLKAHARISGDDENELIAAMLLAARAHIETLAGLALITQSWRILRDDIPQGGIVVLPVRPIQSVSQVTLYGAKGEPEVLPPADYLAETVADRPRILFRRANALSLRAMNGVEIDVVAGFGDTSVDVPTPLRQAILMLAAHWYDHRATGFDFTAAGEPEGLGALVRSYRQVRV